MAALLPLLGVAAIVERFYKPELDSLHNPHGEPFGQRPQLVL
jgi:hypothetical protein